MVLDKTIEMTLLQQGIDPEKVPMKDFDRIRRLTAEMDRISDRARESIAKIQAEEQAEINKTVAELDAITKDIREKQNQESTPEVEEKGSAEN